MGRKGMDTAVADILIEGLPCYPENVVGFIDLCPDMEHKQIIIYDPEHDEPLVKIVFTPDGPRVVVNKECKMHITKSYGIYANDHARGWDREKKEKS